MASKFSRIRVFNSFAIMALLVVDARVSSPMGASLKMVAAYEEQVFYIVLIATERLRRRLLKGTFAILITIDTKWRN